MLLLSALLTLLVAVPVMAAEKTITLPLKGDSLKLNNSNVTPFVAVEGGDWDAGYYPSGSGYTCYSNYYHPSKAHYSFVSSSARSYRSSNTAAGYTSYASGWFAGGEQVTFGYDFVN
jgi:lactococcin 972 family bacteriocin